MVAELKDQQIQRCYECEACTNCCGQADPEAIYMRGLCSIHYWRRKREAPLHARTKFTPNNMRVYENHVEMDLYDVDQNLNGVTVFDLEDMERVKEHKWYLDPNGYVRSGNRLSLHRFILDPIPDDLLVDHINGDKVDNRKMFLRLVNHQQNRWNTQLSVGIRKDKIPGKWTVYIETSFDTEELAIKQRKLWETHRMERESADLPV